jgi:Carbohydrate-binding module 48 (Isoamylase N-terminal domain)
MDALRVATSQRRDRRGLASWFEPRAFVVRPILAVVAGIVVLLAGVWLGRLGAPVPDNAPAPQPSAGVSSPQAVRFVFVAPQASRVSLVGDFNDWDAGANPMRRSAANDEWTVTVPIASGWHAYAFVVDETRWVNDPHAPLAPPDGLGGPRSVVVVEERGI